MYFADKRCYCALASIYFRKRRGRCHQQLSTCPHIKMNYSCALYIRKIDHRRNRNPQINVSTFNFWPHPRPSSAMPATFIPIRVSLNRRTIRTAMHPVFHPIASSELLLSLGILSPLLVLLPHDSTETELSQFHQGSNSHDTIRVSRQWPWSLYLQTECAREHQPEQFLCLE